MADTDTLLLAVNQLGTVEVGLPPQHPQDSFSQRAIQVGSIKDISALACSPDGELFCLHICDLYRGPMPSKKDTDWLTVARRVARFNWRQIKLIFFHPNGDFYCTTHDGELYKGPPPDNENVPWIYNRATRIGNGNWQSFSPLLFHPNGNLYGVTNDRLYSGPPPTDEKYPWDKEYIDVGWDRYSYFMGFTKDNKLWLVEKTLGQFYKGDAPTPESPAYFLNAEYLGWSYFFYSFFAFTKDKTIRNIISFDFLVDEGERLSETPEVLEEKLYDNRESTSIMRHNYTIKKAVKEISSFSHEHGFTFEAGIETSFKGGIPFVSEASTTIKLNMSNTNTWNLTTVNETETSFESNTVIELEPGNAIKVVSSVMKCQINIPYKAIARTMFGADVEVRGKWTGVSHYNLTVKQVDFNK